MATKTGRDTDVLRDARKATWNPEQRRPFTQEDMAKRLNKSVKAIVEYEKRPDQAPISVWQGYYSAVGPDGRVWIKEAWDSFLVA